MPCGTRTIAKPLSAIENHTQTMIDIYNKIAVDRGGKCLSKEYVNTQTKLKFECEKGHQWNALPYSIKKGQWCKKCSDAKRSMLKREQGLLEAKEYAHSKSGKCLSDEYKGSHSPLDWNVKKGTNGKLPSEVLSMAKLVSSLFK